MKYTNIKGQEEPINALQFIYKSLYLMYHRIRYRVRVMNIDDTLDLMIQSKKSIARFGDGEMNIIRGNSLDFQHSDRKLACRLQEILESNQNKCLIGVTPALNRVSDLKLKAQKFWVENMYENRRWWVEHLKGRVYCSANITRPYIDYRDFQASKRWLYKIRKLWNERKVLIVEGEGTRFGVGNKLLNNAEDVKRILCPARNAFAEYGRIMEAVEKYDREYLVLIALGPTATVLAYDLAHRGYQAVDIGHCDLEYEWFRRKAKYKEIVPGKYTNEVRGGDKVAECQDYKYYKQIVAVIGKE